MKIEEADVMRLCHSFVVNREWAKAWTAVNSALNEYPDSTEGLYLAGVCLREQGNLALALPVLGKALANEQRQPNLWMNYAATLHDLHRYDEAIRAFSIVHGMIPNDPMPPANIAASHLQLGKWHDTLNWCAKSFTNGSDNYIAHISAAFANLALGRWKDAWKHAEYMYGNHLVIRVYNKADEEESDWDGSPGKTVVVQCDQGLGDIIMFSQMIPQMAVDCKEVIVECAERMVPFFKRNFPMVKVYGTLKQKEVAWAANHKIDAHVHISFLGRWYRNSDKDFPRKPYIVPCPEKVAKWKEWLGQFPKPWRGLAWKGGIQQTLKHIRSIDLADFKPIVELPGTNIDLSYHDSAKDIERSGFDIKRPPIDVSDYEDTIALVSVLDDVFTVTTTVAHVCGALGRKASVLVPDVPTWRYAYRFDGGDEMIWYPSNSVRLFRRKPGELDWTHAIKRAVKRSR